jgi:hypothetical protein
VSDTLREEELRQAGQEKMDTRLLQELTRDAESTATDDLTISARVSDLLLEQVEQNLKASMATPTVQ